MVHTCCGTLMHQLHGAASTHGCPIHGSAITPSWLSCPWLCRAEILAGSVDGAIRRFDVRMGRLFTDELHHPVTCVKGGWVAVWVGVGVGGWGRGD